MADKPTPTPGPWELRTSTSVQQRAAPHFLIVDAGFPTEVDSVRAEQQANARLIASAPELLEACKNLIAVAEVVVEQGEHPELFLEIMSHAEAAIEKAAGESIANREPE